MVTDASIIAFPGDDILKYLLVVTDFYYKTFDYSWLLELSLEQAARFRRKCLIFIRKPQRIWESSREYKGGSSGTQWEMA